MHFNRVGKHAVTAILNLVYVLLRYVMFCFVICFVMCFVMFCYVKHERLCACVRGITNSSSDSDSCETQS